MRFEESHSNEATRNFNKIAEESGGNLPCLDVGAIWYASVELLSPDVSSQSRTRVSS